MENPKQENAVQIGNTTFYVTSVFSGTVQLEYLIDPAQFFDIRIL